jgi:hypothetical protein
MEDEPFSRLDTSEDNQIFSPSLDSGKELLESMSALLRKY